MSPLQGNICLLAVTFVWSFEVVVHAAIPHGISPFATSCVTSLIGAVLLWGYFFRRIVLVLKWHRDVYARRLLLLGVLNAIYNVLYLIGLEYFNVSVGAFTASMTAVILPVMVLVMKHSISARSWISAGMILFGILVAVSPNIGQNEIPGLALMALGAMFRALFIVKLNEYAQEYDPVTLAAGMTGVSAVLSFIPWVIVEPTTFQALPWSGRLIATYFIYGYFIVAFATVLNIYAQKRTSATHATIIYSTEIVFTTVWAMFLPSVIVHHVEITLPVVIGCLFVVAGNLIEISPSKDDEKGHWKKDDEDDVMILVSHPYARLLDSTKTPFGRSVLLFAALLVVYLVIALPFKVLLVIPGFSDIRPVYMLYPVYGIFFGVPGCLATAFGNLICDVVSDGLRLSSISGFIANFLYPYILYILWTKVPKTRFCLRRRRMLTAFVASFAICSVLQALIITPAVAHFYPDVDAGLFALSVIGNGTLFPFFFAVPFIMLMQEELGYKPLTGPRMAKAQEA
ncbi:DMT family transporter [Slackia heliotrinireducens]|uniref:DMT family transporter n=1 Tax=Slackia heliotrinireducens TaxID=84110 RepID=UPI003314B821